ncbi:hypothetical protein SAMN04488029_2237 [Reichenbachiella faecimaris]|uniref:Uncharacterized protein n=1 Tax=Reichenbachiella faecimaris TaxID=692418 RepID=A0A1W2GEH1_REIFA|nr:hypothetical protein [Reichenbachiella faecimaris]SMD34892.1 hypothetical protein SAMN04488029_2237 [Reichenbachiella faecimaris]
MKHIIFSMALLIPIQVFCQMIDIFQNEQLSISRLYAGLNSTTLFQTDSISSQSQVNLRVGIKSELALSDQIILKTWGAIQISKLQPVAGYNSFGLMTKPTKKITWHVGLIATPTTVIRPNPTTWESQVETHTQSTIIPGRPGTKVSYSLATNSIVTYGYFNHGELWVHHLNISIHDWRLAGYLLDDGAYFAAFTYRKGWLENTTTFNSAKELSASFFINLKKDFVLMLDAEYALNQEEAAFLQTGIRKYIQASPVHLSGFFGLTYDWKTQVVIGQIFIHLS